MAPPPSAVSVMTRGKAEAGLWRRLGGTCPATQGPLRGANLAPSLRLQQTVLFVHSLSAGSLSTTGPSEPPLPLARDTWCPNRTENPHLKALGPFRIQSSAGHGHPQSNSPFSRGLVAHPSGSPPHLHLLTSHSTNRLPRDQCFYVYCAKAQRRPVEKLGPMAGSHWAVMPRMCKPSDNRLREFPGSPLPSPMASSFPEGHKTLTKPTAAEAATSEDSADQAQGWEGAFTSRLLWMCA